MPEPRPNVSPVLDALQWSAIRAETLLQDADAALLRELCEALADMDPCWIECAAVRVNERNQPTNCEDRGDPPCAPCRLAALLSTEPPA